MDGRTTERRTDGQTNEQTDELIWVVTVGPVLVSATYLICGHILTDGWMDGRTD